MNNELDNTHNEEYILSQQKSEVNEMIFSHGNFFSNFDLLNKYVKILELNTYKKIVFSEDYLKNQFDTANYDLKHLHNKAIKKLIHYSNRRIKDKKPVNLETIQELIHVINQTALIYNKYCIFKNYKDTIIRCDKDLITINLELTETSQKTMKEILDFIK